MVGMFCSLKEAAERLQVSEGEIEAMLQQGTLREFREGPHRLVKTADVGALAQSLVMSPADSSWTPIDGREMKLPHRAAVAMRVPAPSMARPRNIGRRPPREVSTSRGRRAGLAPPGHTSGRTSGRVRRTDVPAHDQSVRQWFWNGLIQDRPLTVAILFGLVLLSLSALIVGVYVLSSFVARR